MALSDIQKVRITIGDTEPGLYILSDDEISYFLEASAGSIGMASLKAAQSALFKLSTQADEQVDIFSIKSSGAARAYIEALKLFIKNPASNPVMQNIRFYVGGVSKSDMEANDANPDNNLVPTARTQSSSPADPFSV